MMWVHRSIAHESAETKDDGNMGFTLHFIPTPLHCKTATEQQTSTTLRN